MNKDRKIKWLGFIRVGAVLENDKVTNFRVCQVNEGETTTNDKTDPENIAQLFHEVEEMLANMIHVGIINNEDEKTIEQT